MESLDECPDETIETIYQYEKDGRFDVPLGMPAVIMSHVIQVHSFLECIGAAISHKGPALTFICLLCF